MVLEKILESYPKVQKAQRNFQLNIKPKSLIFGAFGIGKTNLVLDFFTKEQFSFYKKLYIDLDDVRLNLNKDLEHLRDFVEKENIEVLILDNFNPKIPLLKAQNLAQFRLKFLVLISTTPAQLEQFSTIEIPPLTFLEFYKLKKISLDDAFNAYLRFGNLLEQNKAAFLKLITRDSTDFWILKNLILHLGQKVSIYQIFTKLKKEGKLSKDRFYEFCKILETNKMLFWVNKFEHKLAPKKLYFWDFTLKNALSFDKNFTLLFENMVFLELVFNFKVEVFYSDRLDFYIPSLNLGIICAPFVQNLNTRLNKLGKEREFCDSLLIISLNVKENGEYQGMPYNIAPFSEFALQESL